MNVPEGNIHGQASMAFGLFVWRLSCGVLRASWVCGLASGVRLGEFSVVIASNASSVPSSSPPPRRSRHVSGCSVLFPFFGRCSLGFSTWAVSVEMSSSSDTLPVAVSRPGAAGGTRPSFCVASTLRRAVGFSRNRRLCADPASVPVSRLLRPLRPLAWPSSRLGFPL